MSINIRYLSGGPCHPVNQQAPIFQEWLGNEFHLDARPGRQAFEDLDDVDLFIAAGLHFSTMEGTGWPDSKPYIPMTDEDFKNFRAYVASGRPVIGFHGGVASFDDYPGFPQLLGVYWNWASTAHTPVGDWTFKPVGTDSPISAGVGEFESNDEIYYNLQIDPSLRNVEKHLTGHYHEMYTPLIFTAEGGRVEGAGKVAYFGPGHSMESVQAPEIKTLFINTVRWATH